MNRYDGVRRVKRILVAGAVLIVVASLWVSHGLISDLKNEEQTKMGVWAEAMRSLTSADETTDLNLVLRVINDNHTIPVIVTDEKGRVTTSRNLRLRYRTSRDSVKQVNEALARLKAGGHSMHISLGTDEVGETHATALYIYYGQSLLLQRLAWFPYVQLGVVTVFLLVALLALLSTKRAEQNKVWVGLTKETAHQLGTPISSLMAWMAVMRETHPDDALIDEMEADVRRLEMVAERFSKIGSAPKLHPETVGPIVERVAEYIARRIPKSVKLTVDLRNESELIPISAPLVEWVVEVLCKNAADAMPGVGQIGISGGKVGDRYVIDVADTGKGIERKHHKTVFRPGFTTKQRGWGLGLSLAKRIIEEYHHGRIYVLRSAPGEGTVFRIELPINSQ
ncbi:MAG: ATP-binding protein [Prevotellaceae bacterium]|nr:ATP-binding protein [Prevotellaceae bacterium]